MGTITIRQAETEEDVTEVRTIFREYESWLDLDLCFQRFEDELKTLPGKYSPPGGRLFLARVDEQIAGCIALRPLAASYCEMKRLFVRESFRGMRIGKLLIDRLIEEGRDIGYATMRLDTFPSKMGKAVRLYESYGFRKIPAYYNNPTEGVLFMELDLMTKQQAQ